jgi:hypothetical protein
LELISLQEKLRLSDYLSGSHGWELSMSKEVKAMHLQVYQARAALAGHLKTLKALREDSSETPKLEILADLMS